MKTTPLPTGTRGLLAALLLSALAGPVIAQAQYKVVTPDGKVTYTDRPVSPDPAAQVQPLKRDAISASPAGPPLPLDLRTVAGRFPVTLYTSAECPPCDSGRRLLQQRGIPYSERTVASDEDIAALQRLSGSRTVPALTVGGQALRGFLDTDWQTTLDLAGYPKESRLPRGWQPPPPTPLVARADVTAPPVATAPAPAATPRPAPEPATAPSGAPGIRF